jgi:pimeloyl-ACP methyl ester carboxylesterase
MASFKPPFRLGKLPPLRIARTRQGKLAYVLSGSGRPSIVLVNGAGVTLEGWRALYPGIEALGTVLAWNRFGVKGSDAPSRPQDGEAVVAAMRELLDAAALAPPYVLVAHSLGGLYANLFARLHPADVAGVLFLEATHPGDPAVLKGHETVLARAIGKVLALPQWVFRRNLHEEMEWVEATAGQVEAAGPFPGVPVRVVTGGQAPPAWMMSPAAVGARRAHQQDLARLSPRGAQVIAQHSGHFPQLTQAPLVLRELQDLVARIQPPA